VPRDGTARVMNLQPIMLKVVLDGPSLKLDDLCPNTAGVDDGNLSVLISRISGGQASAVTSKAKVVIK